MDLPIQPKFALELPELLVHIKGEALPCKQAKMRKIFGSRTPESLNIKKKKK